MIASSIRQEILDYAERTRVSNAFMLRAAEGRLPGDAVARYLASLRYMLEWTPTHLQRSFSIAEERGAEKLAAYFAQKLREEQGHDAWAASDVRALVQQFKLQERPAPVPSMVELARYLGHLIERDPRLYLTYILWAEFITAQLGTELVGYLEQRCGVARGSLSAVVKHVELDGDHADSGFYEVDALVEDPDFLPRMRETMVQFTQMFEQACREMVDPSPPQSLVS